MLIDTVILSRVQFGFTIAFHILYPSFSIGTALFLVIMEAVWLKTKNPAYLSICQFWTKIFALTFGMGVVSGIVMSYELGTNFGHFTNAVGGVLGSLFAYEVLTAFFLEAGFLGIMLFGWNRVGPKLHFSATLLVTIGTTISAFWIMAANSWMQTPAGFLYQHGKFIVDNWWHVIFNPSTMIRFLHMIVAAYIASFFVIAGVNAWYLRRQRHTEIATKCLSFVLIAILILTALQIFIGDRVGLEVHHNQPIKTAAIEGVWKSQHGAPLLLFAIPDPAKEKNLLSVKIPHGAALINTHQWNGYLQGLDSVPAKDRPVVIPVFYCFRVMVGLGIVMLLLAIYGCYLLKKQRLFHSHGFLKLLTFSAPSGFIAIICGWITAEMGRQPWVVYHYLRTAQGASVLPISHVIFSLSLFVFVYFFVFGFYLFYLFNLIRQGPKPPALDEGHHSMLSMKPVKEQ